MTTTSEAWHAEEVDELLRAVWIEVLLPFAVIVATLAARALLKRLGPLSRRQRYTMQLTLDSHARVTFAIDVTGSMSTRDCPDGLTRLEYAARCIDYLVQTAPPQLKRFDIMAFGTALRYWYEVQRDEVAPLLARLQACESQTYTSSVVNKAARMLVPGRTGVLVIFTDGEPTDPAQVTLALSNTPTLNACALSVGRVRLECAVARAEDTLLAWAPRVEPMRPVDESTPSQWGRPSPVPQLSPLARPADPPVPPERRPWLGDQPDPRTADKRLKLPRTLLSGARRGRPRPPAPKPPKAPKR